MLTPEEHRRLRLVIHRLRAVQDCLIAASTRSDRMVLRNELLMLQLDLDLVLDDGKEEEPE